jgi:hypothetical protein
MDIFSTYIVCTYHSIHQEMEPAQLNTWGTRYLAIFLAFECAYLIIYSGAGEGHSFSWTNLSALFLGVTPFWLLALYLLKATEIPRSKQYISIFWEYFLAAGAIFCCFLLIYFLFKLYTVSRTFIVLIPLFGFAFLFTLRILEYKVFKQYRAKGSTS